MSDQPPVSSDPVWENLKAIDRLLSEGRIQEAYALIQKRLKGLDDVDNPDVSRIKEQFYEKRQAVRQLSSNQMENARSQFEALTQKVVEQTINRENYENARNALFHQWAAAVISDEDRGLADARQTDSRNIAHLELSQRIQQTRNYCENLWTTARIATKRGDDLAEIIDNYYRKARDYAGEQVKVYPDEEALVDLYNEAHARLREEEETVSSRRTFSTNPDWDELLREYMGRDPEAVSHLRDEFGSIVETGKNAWLVEAIQRMAENWSREEFYKRRDIARALLKGENEDPSVPDPEAAAETLKNAYKWEKWLDEGDRQVYEALQQQVNHELDAYQQAQHSLASVNHYLENYELLKAWSAYQDAIQQCSYIPNAGTVRENVVAALQQQMNTQYQEAKQLADNMDIQEAIKRLDYYLSGYPDTLKEQAEFASLFSTFYTLREKLELIAAQLPIFTESLQNLNQKYQAYFYELYHELLTLEQNFGTLLKALKSANRSPYVDYRKLYRNIRQKVSAADITLDITTEPASDSEPSESPALIKRPDYAPEVPISDSDTIDIEE